MPDFHEDFQYLIEKFGDPECLRTLDEQEIERFRDRIPESLLTFWEHYGICEFWGGLLRLCHPDDMRGILRLAFGNDPELDPERCHVVAHNAFGELYIWSELFQRLFLDLVDLDLRGRVLEEPSRRIEDEDRAVAFLFAGEKRDFDRYDQHGKLLFSRCRSRLGALEADECYGFVPALLVGGEDDISNMRRVKAREHFAILAQLKKPDFVRILPNGKKELLRPIGYQ